LFKNLWQSIVDWYQSLQGADYIKIGTSILKIILIIVLAWVVIRVSRFLIERFFKKQAAAKSRFALDSRKANTLNAVLQNLIKYIVYFAAVLMILSELGVQTASLIAAAGVGGVAIGFGAQSLVKDIISGFFILFEDQYAVGDFIEVNDIMGTVTEIGLRTTRIMAYTGEEHIIPNGEITRVTNYSRSNHLAIVDMGIAYETDIDKASAVMLKVAEDFAAESEAVVKPPEILGVMSFDASSITLRAVVWTAPMQHWGIERELRKRYKAAFEQNGIEIPFPHRVIIQKDAT
jgi:small-conductance mechanosensitive channel